ncbi:MAG: methyltransferase domain-containing protein [Acidobacteriota bacterium]
MIRSNRNALVGTVGLVLLMALGGLGYRFYQFVGLGDERVRLAEAMGVHEGEVLADVGAGDGSWSLFLASQVGRDGKIYATEVDDAKFRQLQERSRQAPYGNVEAVLGTQEGTGLPAACCEGILLRRVYHHFEDPPAMLADIRRALKPDGVLAVIDFNPTGRYPLSNVPVFRHGHGVPMETTEEEIRSAGFVEVRRIAPWAGWDATYFLLFRKAPEDSGH